MFQKLSTALCLPARNCRITRECCSVAAWRRPARSVTLRLPCEAAAAGCFFPQCIDSLDLPPITFVTIAFKKQFCCLQFKSHLSRSTSASRLGPSLAHFPSQLSLRLARCAVHAYRQNSSLLHHSDPIPLLITEFCVSVAVRSPTVIANHSARRSSHN